MAAEGARFALTVSIRSDAPTVLPIVTAGFDGSDGLAISKVATDVPASSYWVDTWGGTLSAPAYDSSWVIGNRYLTQVYSYASMIAVSWSYYIDPSRPFVWMNTGAYVWTYNSPSGASRAEQQLRFSSAVADPVNAPSDDTIDGLRHPTRLSVPSTALQLSAPTHGVSLSDMTSFTIMNNDGAYDSLADNMLHAQVRLRKSFGGEFLPIYFGEVLNVENNFDTLKLKCSQRYGTLTQPATRTIEEALGDLLDDYELEDDVEGKQCPRVYGSARYFEPVKLGTASGGLTIAYAFHDPTTLTGSVALKGVHFEDPITVVAVVTYPVDGVFALTWPTLDDVVDVSTVSAATRDAVSGEIYTGVTAIRDILLDRADLATDDSTWDLVELQETIDKKQSATIGTVLDGGTVQSALDTFTRTGLYHFLEKPDGRLTVRIFGDVYGSLDLANWKHTVNPVVTYADRALLATSARVRYNSDAPAATEENVERWALNSEDEVALLTTGGSSHRLEVETDIADEDTADELAADLVRFFGKRLRTVAVAVGENLSELTQLDTIKTDILINGRQIAEGLTYLVANLDRSQDTALLYFAGDFAEITDILETGLAEDEILETGDTDDEILETGVAGL